MIILEKPYVSKPLIKYMVEKKVPVLRNEISELIACKHEINLVGGNEFKEKYIYNNTLYTNSESAIKWVYEHIQNKDFVNKIQTLKDKVAFRKLLKTIYPDLFFEEINLNQLKSLDISELKKPFILKPAIGFFSMGVYKITSELDWQLAVEFIHDSLSQGEALYSKSVINNNGFIIEEFIEGDEYAVDAYFDCNGEPVILNILEHIFSSKNDVSDRLYSTSKIIIEEHLEKVTNALIDINNCLKLKNFPFHAEFRIKGNIILPVEINPLRFAGWCVTDLAISSYNINTYQYYLENLRPDWDEILGNKENKIYSVVVLDKPDGYTADKAYTFDYEKLLKNFEKPLELRKINYGIYPVFGFLFLENQVNNKAELDRILKSELWEYISEEE